MYLELLQLIDGNIWRKVGLLARPHLTLEQPLPLVNSSDSEIETWVGRNNTYGEVLSRGPSGSEEEVSVRPKARFVLVELLPGQYVSRSKHQ